MCSCHGNLSRLQKRGVYRQEKLDKQRAKKKKMGRKQEGSGDPAVQSDLRDSLELKPQHVELKKEKKTFE